MRARSLLRERFGDLGNARGVLRGLADLLDQLDHETGKDATRGEDAADMAQPSQTPSQLQKERLPEGLIARHLTGNRMAMTFVTEGELEKWAERRSWGSRRRDELHAWIRRLYVLAYDKEVACRWGGLAARAELRGRPRPVNDMWIAACCLAAGLSLLTLNRTDFDDFAENERLVLLS